ncbi:MAG: hypothetical protein KKD28_11895, partial [Chloroflexi bacterium]|nr:hypothetical protein [Chloroflexota bacterium]
HHRFVDGQVEYDVSHGNGTLYYDSDGDDHPNGIGNQKATAEFVPMLNIFYHRWISAAPTSPPPAAEEPTLSEGEEDTTSEESPPPAAVPETFASSGLFDDFESDGPPPGTNGWEAFWDEAVPTTLSCGVDSSVAQAGLSSLRLDFYIEPDSWAACTLLYDENPGLGGIRGLAFDYRATAPALIFDVDAHGGTSDARSTYAYSVETVPESVDGWVHVELTWDQIVRVDWEENPGTPVNPAEINGFAFGFGTYPGTPNSGTIWIDNLSLLGDEISEPSEPEPELYAEESPSDDAESLPDDEEGSGGLCPSSMALGALMVAGVGLSMMHKRQRK